MESPRLIQTGDGSHSVYLSELNEHYHSTHGALTESQHVFIENGLCYLLKKKPSTLSILEVGFGTGLNCLLTYLVSEKQSGLKVSYEALEPSPLELETINQLNYPTLLGVDCKSIYLKMHDRNLNEKIHLATDFSLKIHELPLEEFFADQKYDLIYFDAFGPRVQPELWTKEAMQKISQTMHQESVLVTYCAQGAFRRNLLAAGLKFQALPGPPGKREMTRAYF